MKLEPLLAARGSWGCRHPNLRKRIEIFPWPERAEERKITCPYYECERSPVEISKLATKELGTPLREKVLKFTFIHLHRNQIAAPTMSRAMGVLALEDLPIVLVTEDDELIQSIVEDALTEGGFEPVIASSGENAAELLDAFHRKYRALVTDIKLGRGKMEGWEVARHAREIDPAFPTASCWPSRSRPRSLSPLFPNFSMLLRHQHKSAAAHTIAEEETAFTRTLQGVSER